jgi:hypothetical protein
MSKDFGQLLSVRIQNIADGADGHNNESALYETAFDNPLDVNATELTLLVSETNLAWAILDNGPGIQNIYNLWGTGEGIKIKSGDKIGNKIAGEFAACTFFQADRTMYFSRCNKNSIDRKHQQLNAQMNKIVQTVKTPDIDLNMANDLILKGPNRLLRRPEPDDDSFDVINVAQVKELFKNNEEVSKYFKDNERSGMLKVFKYEKDNQYRFLSLLSDLQKIFEKAEFITYNTIKGFRGDKIFRCVFVDMNITKCINKDTCNANFILGKKAIIDDDDEDISERSTSEDENLGNITEKALSINNYVYKNKNNGKFYIHVVILDFDIEFLISEDEPRKHLGNAENKTLKDSICTKDNFICEINTYLSFVDKLEAEEQAILLAEKSTLEQLKQCYVYYNGRYLNKCKIPRNMGTGIQERSLPHFRIVICLNELTSPVIKIRSNKTLISLDTSHPIFQKQMVEILKPILQLKSTNIISTGIDDWSDYNNEVLKKLCVIRVPTVPATNVFISELNKAQTIKELNRIKSRISDESLTKAQKKKLLTKLYDIEREIILDNDMLEEKIEEIIATVSSTEINKYVKNSSALLNL